MVFSKVDETCTPQLRIERLKRRIKIVRRRSKNKNEERWMKNEEGRKK